MDSGPQQLAERGSGSIVELLLAIEREDESGVVEFRARDVITRIFARDGEIIHAEGGALSETLGRALMRTGRLGEEHIAHVIRRMIDQLVDGNYSRLGATLVEYGFMDANELEIALTIQLKDKLMGCVHRGFGEWRFRRTQALEDDVVPHPVRARPMLVDAALRFPERRLEDVLELDENRYPELLVPDHVVIEEFELSKTEASLLRELDGTSSIHFLCGATSFPRPLHVAPIIAALVLGGAIALRDTPNPERRPSKHRSIPPGFRTSRRAYESESEDQTVPFTQAPVTRPSQPDALASRPGSVRGVSHSSPTITVASPSSPSFGDGRLVRTRERLAPASEREPKIRAAIERLKADLDRHKPLSKRRRWPDPKDERERRLMAESAFHQGRLQLRADEAERSLPGLYRALELCPDEPEYELYVKWAQMLVNDAFKDDARRADVQWLAEKVVRANRDCELGLSILGHTTMHEGKDEAALRFFQRAAILDPKLVDAGRLARLLAMRSVNKLRRPLPSKVDASVRRAERGDLDPALDEVVPRLEERPSDVLENVAKVAAKEEARLKATRQRSRLSSADGVNVEIGAPTPFGGLRVASTAPPSPDGTLEGIPPPPNTAVLPPQSSNPSPAAPPAPTPKLPTPSAAPVPQGLGPSQPPPWSVPPPPPSGTVVMKQPIAPSIPPNMTPGGNVVSIPPAAPIPTFAPRPPAMSIGELPTGRPKHRGVVIAIGWLISLAATGALFYSLGTHDGERSPSAPSEPIHSADVALSSVSVATAPLTPASEDAEPKAAPSPSSSTGTIQTPRSYGRRIYLDGHMIGEGGRAFTVPCGPHKVKIGSAGSEHSVSIPCGGSVELE